jgi:hypothetical protein
MENNTCGLCKAETEIHMHALIDCSHAKMFWKAAKELLLVKLPRLHPLTWERDILCAYSVNKKGQVCYYYSDAFYMVIEK